MTRILLYTIPYKVVGGVRFYERKEVKDLLAYLRVIVNPDDEVSMRRIINTPKRGIGDRALDNIDDLAKSEGLSFWQALNRASEAGLTPKTATSISFTSELVSGIYLVIKKNVNTAITPVPKIDLNLPLTFSFFKSHSSFFE